MNEQLPKPTPRETSAKSAKFVENYRNYYTNAEKARSEATGMLSQLVELRASSADNAATKYYNVLPEYGKAMSRSAEQQIEADVAVSNAGQHYAENQEAYVDTAIAEAALDNVHINVEQVGSPEQINVQHK